MQSLQGHFLIASPHLVDPNFLHAVVLLIQHTPEGAFGVVVNRPTEGTIRDLWNEVGEGTCDDSRSVRLGGPVSGPLVALHTDAAFSELEILPGVYFAAQRENLEELVARPDHPYRLFVGHSGWGEGQLERELDEGSWLTTAASAEDVFYDNADDEDLWRKVTQQIGRSIFSDSLHIKHIPSDPSAN